MAWAASRPPPHPRGSGRASPPRAELGFQVDPLATSSSLIVFGAYGGLQLKISRATSKRLERDAAAERQRYSPQPRAEAPGTAVLFTVPEDSVSEAAAPEAAPPERLMTASAAAENGGFDGSTLCLQM